MNFISILNLWRGRRRRGSLRDLPSTPILPAAAKVPRKGLPLKNRVAEVAYYPRTITIGLGEFDVPFPSDYAFFSFIVVIFITFLRMQ
jgi:hypothetical protein